MRLLTTFLTIALSLFLVTKMSFGQAIKVDGFDNVGIGGDPGTEALKVNGSMEVTQDASFSGNVGINSATAAIDCSTETYSNVEVTADDTFDGCKVNISEVTVKNNSKLTVVAASDLVINGSFEIKSGSELEIK